MQIVTSFRGCGVPPDQLGAILADYLALDRARIIRRLLVARFTLLALVAPVLSTILHHPSLFVRWFASALCLVPPVWAWVAEMRLERRVSERLDAAGTHEPVSSASSGDLRAQLAKVIKNS